LTLLVGQQEGHPACKKTEWWGAGMVICLWSEVQTCTWLGTNLIHDFTAVTSSVKLAFFREKRPSSVKNAYFREIRDFS